MERWLSLDADDEVHDDVPPGVGTVGIEADGKLDLLDEWQLMNGDTPLIEEMHAL